MSFVAQRALPAPRARSSGPARLARLVRQAPSLAVPAALVGLAALVLTRWWRQADSVPLSWQPPSADVLFLLPGAPVMALLALRSVVALRDHGPAGQPLARAVSRWAVLWTLVTAVWVLRTLTDLYGTGARGLLDADNLPAVVAASDDAGPRLTVLWVALLVATFGGRLSGRTSALALATLTGAAVLVAVPASGAAHGHESGSHPLVQVALAAQVLALVLWLGAVVAVLHLGRVLHRGHHLVRLGDVVSTAALVLGTAVVLAGALRPGDPTPGGVVVAQLVAVVTVVAVGHRHRRRSVGVVGGGPRSLLLALVLGELLVLVAVVATSAVLPLG